MEFFLCVIGMVMFVEGLPYATCPQKMKLAVMKLAELPDNALRRFGIILMFAGVAIVYIGKS